jgi:hypothetical protein
MPKVATPASDHNSAGALPPSVEVEAVSAKKEKKKPPEPRPVSVPIPGLTADEQSVLNALVRQALARGEWSFTYQARVWIVDAGLLPTITACGFVRAMRRLDRATAGLIRLFLIQYEEGPPGAARVWSISPSRLRELSARTTPAEKR